MSGSKAALREPERTVILMRHGVAEERAPDGKDASRRLTAAGRKRIAEVARGLRELIPDVEAVYTSALLRSVQTAHAVAKAYGGLDIITADALAPGGGVSAFRKLLGESGHRVAVFVGHEPDLTAVALALLAAGRLRGRMALKKGGCYVLSLSAGAPASLDLLLTPRVLRRL